MADGLKNIVKEETYPAHASQVLFLLAPALSFIPALMLSGVIPFAAPLPLDSADFGSVGTFIGDLRLSGRRGRFAAWLFHLLFGQVAFHGPLAMVVADCPSASSSCSPISSLGVYGIALAGWSSNSKYSLLAGSGPAPR